jgi:Uncharacterized protein conserved in bacteria (DUF2147)
MKKVIYVFVLTFFFCLKMQAQVITEGDKVLGVWLSEEKDGKVEIYKAGNKYMGKLIWSNKMYETDGVTSKKDRKRN